MRYLVHSVGSAGGTRLDLLSCPAYILGVTPCRRLRLCEWVVVDPRIHQPQRRPGPGAGIRTRGSKGVMLRLTDVGGFEGAAGASVYVLRGRTAVLDCPCGAPGQSVNPSTCHPVPKREPLPSGSLPAGILEIPPSPPGAANTNTQGDPAQPPAASGGAAGGTAAAADGAATDGAAAASGTAGGGGGAGLPSERYLEVELASAAGLDRYWTRFEELFRLNTGSTEELQRLKRCFPATSEYPLREPTGLCHGCAERLGRGRAVMLVSDRRGRLSSGEPCTPLSFLCNAVLLLHPSEPPQLCRRCSAATAGTAAA